MNKNSFFYYAHDLSRYVLSRIYIIFARFFFKSIGKRTRINIPDYVYGASGISIGDKVYILSHAWLYCRFPTGSVVIDNNVSIGRGCSIIAIKKIHICESTLIADNVHITDNNHNGDFRLRKNPDNLIYKSQVIIGKGVWIGQNAVIIGVKIGKNAIVAANAVVVDDVPDNVIVGGVPAKFIRYNIN